VLEVAERLHYRPNRIARGLVTGRSHTLGLIVSDVRNPFFAEMARGAEDAARAYGCDLVLCNSDLDQAKQMCYICSLAEKRAGSVPEQRVFGVELVERESVQDCKTE